MPSKVILKLNPKPRHPTLGEIFPDGSIVDLVRDPKHGSLQLLISTGESRRIGSVAEFRGRIYRPSNCSILSAIRLPTGCSSFGSTVKLFAAVRQQFLACGFPRRIVFPLAYFVFSTWFPEVLPIAPCLLIFGPRTECEFLLQILQCLVRRALPLGEVTRSGLAAIPEGMMPTLLINQPGITTRIAQAMLASGSRNFNFFGGGKPRNLFCSKAIYGGEAEDSEIFSEALLRVDIPPLRGRLPILDVHEQQEIAAEFQSKMLDYRCRKLNDVQDSNCDFPEFDSSIRVLGRSLGAPIVGAPELQTDLGPMLRELQDDAQASRAFDLSCVTVEALLHHCHKNRGAKVHVGELAVTVIDILKARGVVRAIEAEVIGRILRKHGFKARRDAKGFFLHLDKFVCIQAHELAHRLQVAAAHHGIQQCHDCRSVNEDPRSRR